MSFTAGVFIFGALLGLIPIIIHLIFRRQSRVVEFPSLMFFRLISKRVARRQNIRELIILLFRVLIIMLISFALANPIITTFGYKGGDSASVLIIIDDSYSMQAITENESVFEQAKRKAFNILSTLGVGDSAEVIFVSEINTKHNAFAFSKDVNNLKQEVLSAQVSNCSTQINQAFPIAVKLFDESPMPNKECYIISDFREPTFREINEKTNFPDDVTVYDVLLEVQKFDSFAITNIGVFDDVVTPNSTVKIRVDVANLAGIECQFGVELFVQTSDIDAEIPVYSETPQIQTVIFAKNEYEKSLYFTIESLDTDVIAGYVTLTKLSSDLNSDIMIDNRRYFAIEVREKESVLLVNGEPNDISFDDEVFYLKAALLADSSESIYNPIVKRADELDFNRLEDFSAVFLCNVNLQKTDETEYEKLCEYVEDGGILVVFPGDKVDASDFNTFFMRDKSEESIMAAGLIEIVFNENNSDATTLSDFKDNIELLQNLESIDVSRITFSDYWKLALLKSDTETDILASFDNKDVFLCSRTTGIGKVFLFAVPADREWSNLPPRKLFPIIIHRILENRKNASNNIEPGKTFQKLLPSKLGKSQVLVRKPLMTSSDFNITYNSVFFTSTGGDSNVMQFPAYDAKLENNNTSAAGVYFNKVNPGSAVSKFSAFTVNPETIEANSTLLTSAQIQDKIKRSQIISHETDIIEFIKKRREGVSIWLILAICCLIAFVVESILANQKLPTASSEDLSKTMNNLKNANIKLESGKN